MKNKKILLFLLATLLILPVVVYAQAGSTGSPALDTALNNIRQAARVIGGVMAVIGFCIAGILYLMSAGSPEKTGVAKKALIAAIIGTAVVVLASATSVIITIFRNLLGV